MAGKSEVSIGLALSGGATRGMAHIGALKALLDNGIRPDKIAGTSIGALVAALYAFGIPIDKMYEHAVELSWLKVSSFSLSRTGLLSNKPIGELIEYFIDDADIAQALIPLAIVTTDIATGEKVVLREGNVAKAVMASTCVPGIFKPVQFDDRLLVDGYLLENVPVTPLQEMGADIIISVNLSARKRYRIPDGIVDIVLNAFDIAVEANMRRGLPISDVVIEPDLFSILESEIENPAVAFFDEGYTATMSRLPSIKSMLTKKRREKKHPVWHKVKNLLGAST